MKKLIFFSLFTFLLISCHQKKEENKVIRVGPQPDGSILVPTNQLLRPAGYQLTFPGRPVDMALSADGSLLAVLNMSSLEIIRVIDRTILQSMHFDGGGSFQGVLFSPDGRRIYVSQARDRLLVAARDKDNIFHWEDPILLPPAEVGGYATPGGMQLAPDGRTLYVVLNRGNTLAVVDLTTKKVLRRIPVGIAPYEVVLAAGKAYVSNWGGRRPRTGDATYPSSGSEMVVDGETGIAASGTVAVIDLQAGEVVKEIETGLHPGALLLSADSTQLFVACASSDYVAVIDTRRDEVADTFSVHIDKDLPFGSAPNALALSADGRTLFVANGTDNAVCVVDLTDGYNLRGFIPTAWYPGALVLDADHHSLIVANIKGVGERNMRADQGGYNTHNPLGSLSFIPLPEPEELDHVGGGIVSGQEQVVRKLQRGNSYAFREHGGLFHAAYRVRCAESKVHLAVGSSGVCGVGVNNHESVLRSAHVVHYRIGGRRALITCGVAELYIQCLAAFRRIVQGIRVAGRVRDPVGADGEILGLGNVHLVSAHCAQSQRKSVTGVVVVRRSTVYYE